MKIAIRTADTRAQELCEKLRAEDNIEVVCYIDKKCSVGQVGSLPVYSVYSALSAYENNDFDKILIPTYFWGGGYKFCRELYEELVCTGYNSKDILFISLEYCCNKSKKLELIEFESLNYMSRLEFHITHRCNLNCAGCCHFVPLVPEEEKDIDFDKIKKDLFQLKSKVDHIYELLILGGEPLLCDNLSDCVKLCRQLWPFAEIGIITNGLLVTRMEETLIKTIKENNVVLTVTYYPSIKKIYGEMEMFLRENGIPFRIDTRTHMNPTLHEDNEHKMFVENLSKVCACWELYDGKIFPCPESAFISYFNKYFGEKYPDGIGVSIYEEMTFTDFVNRIETKQGLCDYCNMWCAEGLDCERKTGPQKFCVSNKKIEEWVM